MIRIQFVEPNIPEWNEWKTRARTAIDQMIADHKAGKEVAINEKLYKEMKQIIFSASFGKCVYCESLIDGLDQPGDVEHYRPKGKVTDQDDQVVTVKSKGNKQQPHPGYFWLAYDWTNLFLACRKCNSLNTDKETGKTYGKGTRFPVDGHFWASSPEELQQERPVLIHPFFQNPEELLEFVPETGRVVGKTEQAKACIELLNLNRQKLVDLRQDVYRNVVARVNTADGAALHNALSDLLGDLNYLTEYDQGKKPYALAGKKALKDVASKLKPIYDVLRKYLP